MSVRFGGIEFDNVFYDRDADVLYLYIGKPGTAVDWDESPEGHHLRFGANGRLVGITVANTRWLLERDGRIVVTPPQTTIEEADLANVLSAATSP